MSGDERTVFLRRHATLLFKDAQHGHRQYRRRNRSADREPREQTEVGIRRSEHEGQQHREDHCTQRELCALRPRAHGFPSRAGSGRGR